MSYLSFHHLRIDGGELFERVIDDDFVLTERSCAVFIRQICEGIEFMHSQRILHLDLKVRHCVVSRFIRTVCTKLYKVLIRKFNKKSHYDI